MLRYLDLCNDREPKYTIESDGNDISKEKISMVCVRN